MPAQETHMPSRRPTPRRITALGVLVTLAGLAAACTTPGASAAPSPTDEMMEHSASPSDQMMEHSAAPSDQMMEPSASPSDQMMAHSPSPSGGMMEEPSASPAP
jgi:hypothetical protein